MDLPFQIQHMPYLVISLLGIFMIVSALRRRRQEESSAGWPGVQARVIESALEKASRTNVDGPDTTEFIPHVRYAYTVLGREYTSNRISFAPLTTNQSPAEQILSRYPAGATVMVYYNPAQPDQAVLERSGGSLWVSLVIGILMIVAGIYYAIK
ncbi:DUF3592 domain-containing protein [bacterium]|nr:DUF3592 domain-containing protein [bacterium]